MRLRLLLVEMWESLPWVGCFYIVFGEGMELLPHMTHWSLLDCLPCVCGGALLDCMSVAGQLVGVVAAVLLQHWSAG